MECPFFHPIGVKTFEKEGAKEQEKAKIHGVPSNNAVRPPRYSALFTRQLLHTSVRQCELDSGPDERPDLKPEGLHCYQLNHDNIGGRSKSRSALCHIHPTHRTHGRTSGLDVVTVMVCPALNQAIQTALVGEQSPERVIMPAPVDCN